MHMTETRSRLQCIASCSWSYTAAGSLTNDHIVQSVQGDDMTRWPRLPKPIFS